MHGLLSHNHNLAFCHECGNSGNRRQHWRNQNTHHTNCHREFYQYFVFFVFDDDLAGIALLYKVLYFRNEIFARHDEFFDFLLVGHYFISFAIKCFTLSIVSIN